MTVNLYSGIRDVAYIGELEEDVLKRPWDRKTISLEENASLRTIGILGGIDFEDLGVRIYFQRGLVKLIEVVQPFPGPILGDKFAFFSSVKPQNEEWRDFLIKRFGKPLDEALGGGLLKSRILIYAWGDIVYNRVGPTQLTLYRDPELQKLRRTTFAGELQLFNQ